MKRHAEKSPLVSVCVPAYNGGLYLRECLDGILGQTFDDFELLLVDDCSHDSTRDIFDEYAHADTRIRIILNKHNLGLVSNWNQCINLARGEWIKFAFQDDLLRKDCLEKMLSGATRPLVFCRREFLFEPGTARETVEWYKNLPDIPRVLGNANDFSPEDVRAAVFQEPLNFFGEPTAALLHKSLFDQFGFFNANLTQLCDLEYWIRVSTNTGLNYIDQPLAAFRYHTSSTSSRNRDPEREERLSVFDRLVLAHEHAYNSHYAALREYAARQTPSQHYPRELAKKAAWVHAKARSLAANLDSLDTAWLDQWNALVTKYPHLGRSHWMIPHWANQFWQRHAGWRFRRQPR